MSLFTTPRTSPIEPSFNFTWQKLIKHDMTPTCKHFPLNILLSDLSLHFRPGYQIFFFDKVEEFVRKACFCSYSFIEQPLELTSQCLFLRSSNKKKKKKRVEQNETNPQQKGTSIQLQSCSKSKIVHLNQSAVTATTKKVVGLHKVTRRIPQSKF